MYKWTGEQTHIAILPSMKYYSG